MRHADGTTPLWIAAQVDVVQCLEQHGANKEVKHVDGPTPLWIAVQRGRDEVVWVLIDCDVDIEAKHSGGQTPL